MDKIFHNFDPPRVVKNWHFHYFISSIPLVTWPSLDFLMTPHPLLLVHVVIEWPLDSIQIKSNQQNSNGLALILFDSFQMEMIQFEKNVL